MAFEATRFVSPVGTDEELASGELWPGDWYSTNPFETYYELVPGSHAYHTGDDLVRWPGGPQHQPVRSIANGVVTYAQRVKNADGQWSTWGNLLVIRHDLPDGSIIFSRYGHVEDLVVATGHVVGCGQIVAKVGNSFGLFAYHLHFDISTDQQLKTSPWDWPGLDRARLERDYVSPLTYLRRRVIKMPVDELKLHNIRDSIEAQLQAIDTMLGTPLPTPIPAPQPKTGHANAPAGELNIRKEMSTTSVVLAVVVNGTELRVVDTASDSWLRIVEGEHIGGYVWKPFVSF